MCVCDREKERERGQNQFVLSRDVIGVYSDKFVFVTLLYMNFCVF